MRSVKIYFYVYSRSYFSSLLDSNTTTINGKSDKYCEFFVITDSYPQVNYLTMQNVQ